MPPDSQFFAFCLIAAVLTVTPGADTLLVVRNALADGRAGAWRTSLGIVSGLFAHAALSALGLSVIIMHSATAFSMLKFAGAAYLVFLGVQSLLAWRPRERGTGYPSAAPAARGRDRYLEGLLSNLLNPKVAVFYLAFLPQFIDPAGSVLAQSLVLATVHASISVVWLGILSHGVPQTRNWLNSAWTGWLHGLSGLALVGLGLRLATSERG
ncbi:MAG: LysE family translocator [Gammaproteobacteria bacterium]|nr:LysE family translocator [Gammaproteobacteria bacterium]